MARRERKKPRVEDPREHEAPKALTRCRYCEHYATTMDVRQVPDPAGGKPYYAVECPGCEGRGPLAITRGLAIKLWNEGIRHEYPRRLRKGEAKAHLDNGDLPQA